MNIERLNAFCDDWLAKAERADTSTIAGIFDQFFAHWIVFNRLYEEAARILAREGDPIARQFGLNGRRRFAPPPDRLAATKGVTKFCGAVVLREQLLGSDDITEAVNTALHYIESGMLFVYENYETGEPDYERDQRLVTDVRGGKAVALLELVYQARCNLFHGQKAYSEAQRPLVAGMVEVLARVIDITRNELERRHIVDA